MIRYRKSAASLCAAFVMLLALGWFGIARVHAQTPAPPPLTIQGQLVNGTRDAPQAGIANVPVTLFQITPAGPVTVTVPTDTQGKFTFTNVLTDANSYFTRVDYQSIRYYSDILPAESIALAPLSLTVYETSTLPADFTIDRVHLVLDVQPKSFNGLQLVQITNPTDRAFYVPLPVPDKTTDVRFEDFREQTRVVKQDDGAVLYPVLPTTGEILYGLAMPFTPPDYALSMPLKTNVSGINLLISKSGDLGVTGPELTPGNPFLAQSGQEYLVYAAPPARAGQVFTAAISNLPGADNTQNQQILILIAGGLGGLALLAYPLYRQSGSRTERTPFRSKSDSANSTAERLAQLQAIARLDDAYAANEIDENAYRAERAALKAELLRDAVAAKNQPPITHNDQPRTNLHD